MKRVLSAFLGMSLLCYACGSDDEDKQQSTTIDSNIVNTEDLQNSEQESQEMPAPGSGTITSDTETPLAKQNQAVYKAADGKIITAVYYFDTKNKGVVVLQQDGIDDITLNQKIEDMPSNAATYSSGTIEWSAGARNAVYTEDGKATDFKLIEAKQ